MFKLSQNNSIDFGYSTFILINKKLLSGKEREELVPNTSNIIDAVNVLENEMSVTRYKQLKVLINKYTFHGYIIRVSCDHPDWSEEEVIDYIRGISAEQFLKDFVDAVIGADKDYSDKNIKERIELSLSNNSLKEVPSYSAYKYLKNHVSEIKDEIVDFLDYYLPLYIKVKDHAIRIANESLVIYQKAFPDTESFIEGFNFLNKDMFDKDINLSGYVTAFMDTAVYLFSVSGDAYFVLGSSLTQLLTKEYQIKKETSLFKCLAEPTKREILSHLRIEDLCSGDIVEKLGLSKSTVSHHMNQLLSANLIYLSLKSGKKLYYSVNVDFMEETFNNVLNSYKD